MLTAGVTISKPLGHALVVGTDSSRIASVKVLRQLGYECDERADPYAAINELCRRPLVYRAIILSLQSMYREELSMITTIRRRFPHINIYLTQTDGRQAAMAEATRLGAEGLLDDDGLHPFSPEAVVPTVAKPMQFRAVSAEDHAPETDERPEPPIPRHTTAEPVLTAEELRALLGEDLLQK